MLFKDAKVGMLVTAYQKGYHVITGKEPGNSSHGIVHLVRVVTEKGDVAPKATSHCDVSYCSEVNREFITLIYNERIQAANKLLLNLTSFLEKEA